MYKITMTEPKLVSINSWVLIANGEIVDIINDVLACKSVFRPKQCFDCIELIKQAAEIPRWKDLIRKAFSNEELTLHSDIFQFIDSLSVETVHIFKNFDIIRNKLLHVMLECVGELPVYQTLLNERITRFNDDAVEEFNWNLEPCVYDIIAKYCAALGVPEMKIPVVTKLLAADTHTIHNSHMIKDIRGVQFGSGVVGFGVFGYGIFLYQEKLRIMFEVTSWGVPEFKKYLNSIIGDFETDPSIKFEITNMSAGVYPEGGHDD